MKYLILFVMLSGETTTYDDGMRFDSLQQCIDYGKVEMIEYPLEGYICKTTNLTFIYKVK